MNRTAPFMPLPVSPIALVGTALNGKSNFMTAAFVSGINLSPPIVMISINKKHLTTESLLESGTFSLNFPTTEMVKETDFCGLVSGRATDKSDIFSVFYGKLKTAPMIEECPICCECRFTGDTKEFAMDTAFFGEVISVYYQNGMVTDRNRINLGLCKPLMVGGDGHYRNTGTIIDQAFCCGREYIKKAPFSSILNRRNGSILTEISERRPCISFRTETEADKLPLLINETFMKLQNLFSNSNAGEPGTPFVIYHDQTGLAMDVEIGCLGSAPASELGIFRNGILKEGSIVSGLHTGPYENLPSARNAIFSDLKNNGYKKAGPVREFYLNSPHNTAPEKLKTLIEIPLKS